jgi:hypothetical protein
LISANTGVSAISLLEGAFFFCDPEECAFNCRAGDSRRRLLRYSLKHLGPGAECGGKLSNQFVTSPPSVPEANGWPVGTFQITDASELGFAQASKKSASAEAEARS